MFGKSLRGYLGARLGGARKPKNNMVAATEPHYIRDYSRMIAALKESLPFDDAMKIAVGGNYEGIGEIERAILEHYGLRSEMALLDLGCGSGRLSTTLFDKDIAYIGIDIMPDLLDYARAKSPKCFKFILHTELNVPVPNESIDMACAFSVFTHLHHDESFLYLQDIFRALKPGGHLIFSFLEFAAEYHWPVFADTVSNKKAKAPQHLNQFIERDVIALWATQLGYELVEFVDGTAHPWNGNALGQAVAVLKKPSRKRITS